MIRKTEIRDADGVAQLAAGLWPETGYETLRREFAADCELTNTDSRRFHLASGFTEANRIICFVKTL